MVAKHTTLRTYLYTYLSEVQAVCYRWISRLCLPLCSPRIFVHSRWLCDFVVCAGLSWSAIGDTLLKCTTYFAWMLVYIVLNILISFWERMIRTYFHVFVSLYSLPLPLPLCVNECEDCYDKQQKQQLYQNTTVETFEKQIVVSVAGERGRKGGKKEWFMVIADSRCRLFTQYRMVYYVSEFVYSGVSVAAAATKVL